jgi:peptidoglycan/LPS O-acetylase OafA/YrhL
VLLSHAGGIVLPWFGRRMPHVLAVSGTFGVTLFFVLSGFLVGRILLRTVAVRPGAGTLGRFLLRRSMRTLPLYGLAVAALAVLQPPAPGLLGRDLLRYLTFTANLLPPQLDDFFPVSWTLAVEEWFYAGFALLLRPLGLPATLGAFLLGPPVARLVLFTDPAQYRIVPFWLDCIGWGVLAAVVAARRPAAFARAARLWPVAAALTAFFWADETWRFTPAGPHRVFGFGAIAAALALFLPGARTLAAPPGAALVRWLSRRSYGLYVTHATILQMLDARHARWGAAPTLLAAALLVPLLPELTWRLVEKPLIDRRPAETGG